MFKNLKSLFKYSAKWPVTNNTYLPKSSAQLKKIQITHYSMNPILARSGFGMFRFWHQKGSDFYSTINDEQYALIQNSMLLLISKFKSIFNNFTLKCLYFRDINSYCNYCLPFIAQCANYKCDEKCGNANKKYAEALNSGLKITVL